MATDQTPRLRIPYPLLNDPWPLAAQRMRELAEGVEAAERSGLYIFGTAANSYATAAITFTVPFPAGTILVVKLTVEFYTYVNAVCQSVSNTGFTIAIRDVRPQNLTNPTTVHWSARPANNP